MNISLPYLQQGGFVVAILLSFSIVALAIILLKLWQFMAIRLCSDKHTQPLFSHLENQAWGQALEQAQNLHCQRGLLIQSILQLHNAGQLSLDELKTEAIRKARKSIAPLGKQLRTLEVIATIAPLLGLFGTVLGMIEAFKAMEAAGSQVDPAVLSGGIWQALLTTAAGLAVAIPVSMVHSWFERKLEVRASILEDDIDRINTLLANSKPVSNAPRAKAA